MVFYLTMAIVVQKFVVGTFQTNCYLVSDKKTGECFLIDPGDEYEKLKTTFSKLRQKPSFIINTHGHMDHIKEDDRFNLSVYIHRDDAECLSDPEKNLSSLFGFFLKVKVEPILLEEGYRIQIGETVFEVLHTPGHSKGSICLKTDKIIFTGDTLFCGGRGRTDMPGGSEKELLNSIQQKLMVLPAETIIYPGHGPSSTIGAERIYFNP